MSSIYPIYAVELFFELKNLIIPKALKSSWCRV